MSTEKINLSTLTSNYLTLSDEPKSVTLTGKYTGDRLVIKNASGKRLYFHAGAIVTRHAEDALVFSGDLLDCEIRFNEFKIVNGGLTFWGALTDVLVSGLVVLFPHTGIRATGDYANKNVTINDCTIHSASHEGIYLGISKNTPNKSTGLRIEGNVIENCGWDGIQVGNWLMTWVINNRINSAGMSQEWGQWHAICVNPGSQVWLWENIIVNTTKHYIINDATAYMENPKTKL